MMSVSSNSRTRTQNVTLVASRLTTARCHSPGCNATGNDCPWTQIDSGLVPELVLAYAPIALVRLNAFRFWKQKPFWRYKSTLPVALNVSKVACSALGETVKT